jgi:hypothetical protein
MKSDQFASDIGIAARLAAPVVTAAVWSGDLVTATPAIISCALLAACLFVIVSRKFREKDKNWAYTTIGALTGFWLRDVS